jgi:hypothetical protein
MLTRFKIASYIFSMCGIVFLASACNGLKNFAANGYNVDRDYSIFSRFSGSYCSLVSEPDGQNLSVNCENLRAMIDPNGDFCQKNKGKTWKAYFPGETAALNLCHDKSYPDRPAQTSLRVMVFGDAGTGDDSTSNERQSLVGEAMAAVCPYRKDLGSDVSPDKTKRGCDFATLVGDIIYPNGIRNPFDSQLSTKFEKPYEKYGGLPFYIASGNHDYYGNVTAMVEYDLFSARWNMPSRYFSIKNLPSWVNIFAIDSIAFTGEDGVTNNFAEQLQAMQAEFCGKSGWKIIFGHFPPLSNGDHGSHHEQALALAETYKTCPFNLYLAGHDHHLEFLTTDKYSVLISGGGGAVTEKVDVVPEGTANSRPDISLESISQKYAKNSHGFSVIEVSESSLDIYFFDIDKWKPEGGIFTTVPSFEDYDFHCRVSKEKPSDCLPVN